MGKQSQAWKNHERKVAEELGGKRVLRGANFAQKDVDVKLSDFPYIKVDCKYRKRWAHNAYVSELVEKYCEKPEDVPVLVTKSHGQVGSFAIMPTFFLGILLQALRDVNGDSDLSGVVRNKILAAKGQREDIPPEEIPPDFDEFDSDEGEDEEYVEEEE